MVSGDALLSHSLVPSYKLLSPSEKKEVLAFFKIGLKNLPKIKINDSMAKSLQAKEGDVIKIIRKDITCENVYYRVVVK